MNRTKESQHQRAAIDAHSSSSDTMIVDARAPEIAAYSETGSYALIDALLAIEMAALTKQQREKAYLDVHCVADIIEETPALIERSLAIFSREICSIQQKDRSAYDLADAICPAYSRDQNFRLGFLRAELFDCKRAALRLIRHFQMKLDLFGKSKLVLDITQDDLEEEAMKALYRGDARVSASSDSGGRMLYLQQVSHSKGRNEFNTIARMRRDFYNLMVLVRDPEAQKRGYVSVCNCSGENEIASDEDWYFPKLSAVLPLRVVALHFCCENSLWMDTVANIKMSFNLQTRIRIRTHIGSLGECLAALQGFGIEPAVVTRANDENASEEKAYRQRLVSQRQEERLTFPLRSKIYVPSHFDVLFGKGSHVQNHVGNQRFRQLVLCYEKEYEKTRRGQKAMISQCIVDSVHGSSGMFLKPNGIAWFSVCNDSALAKASTAFRTLRVDKRSWGSSS